MYEENLDETQSINDEPNMRIFNQKALNFNKSSLEAKNVPTAPNTRCFINYNYQ